MRMYVRVYVHVCVCVGMSMCVYSFASACEQVMASMRAPLYSMIFSLQP